ncbi:MAG TPA: glycosyltransferase [Saprospiraceae bacterium]|nr:glycosyltransferase [Saprospiraceae bacterium]HNT19463.1 glycosyltransferase [Saprospiraceae bacterium]
MHILFIPSWFETPQHPVKGKAMKDLALALAREGIKVNVLFQTGEKLPPVSLAGPGVEIWYSFFPGRGQLYPIWNAGSLRSYLGTFKKYLTLHGRPDLVHIHSYPVLAIAHLLKKKYGIPFLYTEHSSKIAEKKINILEQFLIKRYLGKQAPVFAVSRYLKESYAEYIHNDIHVMPNTIDFKVFKPGRTAFPRHLMMVNTLDQNKQVGLGIKAFTKWQKGYPDACLHIIGDGPERHNLEQLIHQLGMKGKILLWGEKKVEDWLPLLQSASCFLLMSRSESFGVAALEALACRVPVVALQNRGIDEFPHVPGLQILPLFSNELDISQRIDQAIREFDKGQMGLTRAELLARFDFPVVAGKYLEIYKQFLKPLA